MGRGIDLDYDGEDKPEPKRLEEQPIVTDPVFIRSQKDRINAIRLGLGEPADQATVDRIRKAWIASQTGKVRPPQIHDAPLPPFARFDIRLPSKNMFGSGNYYCIVPSRYEIVSEMDIVRIKLVTETLSVGLHEVLSGLSIRFEAIMSIAGNRKLLEARVDRWQNNGSVGQLAECTIEITAKCVRNIEDSEVFDELF